MKSLKGFVFCVALLSALIGLGAQIPEWQWAVQAGGTSDDIGYDIAVDAQSNQYITGSFAGNASFGPFTLTSAGNDDIFAAKLDPAGNFLWAVSAGGTGSDFGSSIAVDGVGNAFLTGYFEGTMSFGPYTLTSAGDMDIFAAKLDSAGNFLWALRAGGTDYDHGTGIAVDDAGNALLTGFFYSSLASFGPYTLTSAGDRDIFAAKLYPSGNFLWAVNAGGTGSDFGSSIAVDGVGNALLTGSFYGTASFGPYTLTSAGQDDIFAAKLDPAGNFLWAQRAGGTGYEHGYGIAVDGAGNAYLTGRFQGNASFGSYTLTSDGYSDIFSAKLDPAGNWLWAIRAGGTGDDYGCGIAVDGAGNAYLTGFFKVTAFFGPYTLTSAGDWDIFAAKLDPAGNFLWAARGGGTSSDYCYGIAVDGAGNQYITGCFYGIASFGPYTLTSTGGYDAFATKLGSGTPVDDALNPLVNALSLSASPNPFSAQTLFSFHLEKAASVELSVYDLRGRKLRILADNYQAPGAHTASWDGRDSHNRELPSGIYLYRLSVGKQTVSGRIMLLR